MTKYILLVCCYSLLSHALDAQELPSPLRQAVLDSLNSRSLQLPAAWKPSSLQPLAAGYLNKDAAGQFAQYIAASGNSNRILQLQQAYAITKDTARLSRYLNGKLRGFYALRQQAGLKGFSRSEPLQARFNTAIAGISYDNSAGAVNSMYSNVAMNGMVALGGIPFTVNYTNIAGRGGQLATDYNTGLAKVSFDKDAYLEGLTSKVKEQYDLKKYFLEDIDLQAAVRSYASQRIGNIRAELDSLYGSGTQLVSADELLQLDSMQLRNLLNTRFRSGEVLADSISAQEKYFKKLRQLKGELDGNGDIRSLLSGNYDIKQRAGNFINDPGSKISAAKDLLPLSGLQKLFLNVKELNAGNIAANASNGSVSNLFMTGGMGSLLSNNRFLMLGAGTRKDAAGLRDVNFTSAIAPTDYSLQFLRLGKGDLGVDHSHVSIVNANTKNVDKRQFSMQSLPRNTFAGSVEKQLSLGAYGALNAELSKSNNSFGNATGADGAALGSKAAALNLMDDLWSTFSAGVNYTGDVTEWQLSQRAYVNYAGLGYNNPGSPYATRGSWQYGLQVKKRLRKNRLVLGGRLDQRNMSTSPVYNTKWKSTQVGFDGRFKLDRHVSFDARYSQSVMKHSGGKENNSDFLTRQLSVGSQVSGTLLSRPSNSHVLLAVQQMDYSNEQAPLHSMLVNMSLTQTLVFNTNVLAVNVFYNKDVKESALYNNLLTAEASWNYQLWKKVSCSSGLTYLNNAHVVRQAGVKQSIQTALLPRLNMSAYIDCRANFFNTAQNYLFGNCRGEVAFHYSLD